MKGEKRKMLVEHETQKIKELEEQYQSELREWKSQLRPRKQVGLKGQILIISNTIYGHTSI